MGILDAYQESTDTALRVMATQPLTPEPVTPKHSTWSAPFRAVAAGAAEVAGNIMDTAGAFGQVAAAAGGLTPGFDPKYDKNPRSELQRINQRVDQFQTAEAFDKLKTEGINWRTDEAQQAYKFGADLRPDPLTAGTAENLVFSLTKGLTKAIGAAVALGPVGGAAAFGASEGMTTAEDLANQGVDPATRTKVGAVTAGFNAAGVLIPVAGKTLAQTAGLVLTGGPLSFMAQQAATREILRNADYKTIAEQYDPLDPVGLTVATLLPAGFAAYAKRGGFGAKQRPDAAPVSDTAPDSNVIAATPEAVDAAMVQNLTLARDTHQDTPAEKFAAELWRGSVTDNPNFRAWFGDSKVLDSDGRPLVVYHGTRSDFDQFNTARQGHENGIMFSRGIYLTANPEYAAMMVSGKDGANIIPAYVRLKNPLVFESYADANRTHVIEWSRIENDGIHDGIIVKDLGEMAEIIVFSPEQIKSAIGNSGKFDQNSPSLTDPAPAARVVDEVATAGVRDFLTTETTQQDITPDAYRARVDQLLIDHPDLVARLDDAGQPVKLADELAAIKKQAQEGTDTDFGALDAPLMKTAIECALSLGAA